MRKNGKLHMFLLFMAGLLISVMIAMMWLGGNVNFQEFLSGGDVYNVSPVSLEQSSRKWAYDEEKEGFWLLKKWSGRYFDLNGHDQPWNYLYLTIRESTMESLSGYIRYYGPDREDRYKQPIELHVGENIVPLNSEIPMVELAIVFQKAQGQFVAVSEIQLRTTPRVSILAFLKCFAVAFAGVSMFLAALLFLKRRFIRNRRESHVIEALSDSVQDVIRIWGDAIGRRTGGRLYPHQRESMRKFLFSVLIVWMMVGNVLGWLEDSVVYRYHVLVCVLLLLAIAFVSWEKPLQNRLFHGTLFKSWCLLWLGIIFCDFFVDRQLESLAGFSMLFAGTVFFCFWQNMDRQVRMFCNLMDALEITFFLGIVYCMVFRMKLPAIDYNGMFRNPEELAMYGVLMASVFLCEVNGLLDNMAERTAAGNGISGKKIFATCLKDITGVAAALFFVLRSGHIPGILIFMLLVVCYLPVLAVKIFRLLKEYRILLVHIIMGVILAFACVCVMFASIKYLPEAFDLDVTYRKELRLTSLQGVQREMFLIESPGSLKGTRTKEPAEIPVIWISYARRLNLFGHGGMEWIFRRYIKPYNAYLDMAYHHGIFILLPYMAFQITMVTAGFYLAFRKKGRRNLFLLSLGIAWVCFSFCANVEIAWGHPLWLCFYLAAGCAGKMGTEENLGKEGLT